MPYPPGMTDKNISKSESPILMKFGKIVVFEKIFDPYFFYRQWLMLKG